MLARIDREHQGRLARVTYDNAARGNSVDRAALESLVATLEGAAGDPDCSLILLTMAGNHFCGGWDTGSFSDLGRTSPEDVAAELRATDEMLDRIRQLPVPVLTGAHGRVIGFGVGLLQAVHLAIAADDLEVSLPEVRFGFTPASVAHSLAQELPRKAAYLLLSGERQPSTEELLSWGLVSRVVPAGQLDPEVEATAARLAALPGDVLRGTAAVVEDSLRTGRPDLAFTLSARSIVEQNHPSRSRGSR